jgi:flagellar hook protein FlgE
MALLKSMNSGVSGLNAFQKKMDVIGNNIANVETIGFKSSRVTFSQLMSKNEARSGAGSNAPQLTEQIGLGVRVGSIDRDFSQGALQSTGMNTDLAIEGDGFFVVNNNGQNYYSRAGNFSFNNDGFLVSGDGNMIQGFMADANGNVNTGTLESLRVDFEGTVPPKRTEVVTVGGNLNSTTSTYRTLQSQSSLKVSGNSAQASSLLNDLDQTSTSFVDGDILTLDITLPDGTAPTTPITFIYGAGAGANGTTIEDMVNHFNTQLSPLDVSVSIVDGVLSVKSTVMGETDLEVNGLDITGTGSINFPIFNTINEGSTGSHTISTTVFDTLGNQHSLIVRIIQEAEDSWTYEASFLDGETITSGKTGNINFVNGDVVQSNFELTYESSNGTENTLTIGLGDPQEGISFNQYGGTTTMKALSQDGYGQGKLIDVGISGDGKVEGVYDNGNTVPLAFLALAEVQNVNGLEQVTGGLFKASSAAGEINTGFANELGSSVASGFLETSNVDLAREFTEMITSQRAYQSNARVITTSDEMLVEAVNLKR